MNTTNIAALCTIRVSCYLPGQTKLQPSSVKGHMLSHSNEWPHSCHICSRKFSQKDWLEKHLSAVHTCGAHVHSAHSPALCDSCGKTFSNRYVCKMLTCPSGACLFTFHRLAALSTGMTIILNYNSSYSVSKINDPLFVQSE